MKILVALAVLALSTPALAAPCTIDPRRASYGRNASVGAALICGGKNLEGMNAQIENGQIVGLSWTQKVGKKDRSVQLYDSGMVFFIVVDDNIEGGFSKKSRGVTRHVFPRGKPIHVEQVGQNIVVHDWAGNTWTLSVTPIKYSNSLAIVAINGKRQQLKPMDFTVPGIIGADVAALGPLVLHKIEPSYQNLTDVRTPKYHKTKSVFVDAKGAKCEVENKLLFGPAPTDPNDKFENAFLFTDDRSLRGFLAQTCPKLDLSVLPSR